MNRRSFLERFAAALATSKIAPDVVEAYTKPIERDAWEAPFLASGEVRMQRIPHTVSLQTGGDVCAGDLLFSDDNGRAVSFTPTRGAYVIGVALESGPANSIVRVQAVTGL